MEQPSLDLEKHPVGDTKQHYKEYNHTLVGGITNNNTVKTYAFVWTKHTSPDATSVSGTLVHGDEVCNPLTKNVSNLVIQQYAKPIFPNGQSTIGMYLRQLRVQWVFDTIPTKGR